MSLDIQNLALGGNKDPFSSASSDPTTESENAACYYIHIRNQQRKQRKSLTTVQGLDKKYDSKRILTALKKAFNCNGTVIEDPEMGTILQLQGDQRNNVAEFLLKEELVTKDQIKIHGA